MQFKASQCQRAITDEALQAFSESAVLDSLEYMDISMAIQVTDEGLKALAVKNPLKIKVLFISGLTKVSNDGLAELFGALQGSLEKLTMIGLDQVR
jgi:hypothetical protein